MRIVQITTDSREHFKDYDRKEPYFGAAPEALLQGFASLPGVEVHVVSCLRQAVESPAMLADNIYYHSLVVPKTGWIRTGYQGCVRAIRSLLREISPEIVHGQGTEKECAISAVYSGYPNVVTIHGNMAELQRLGLQGHRYFGLAASFLETHALKRTRGVFCNSRYTQDLVAPRAKQTWRVPNAIRAGFFEPATGEAKRPIPTLVNVGLIGSRKRQLELLRMVGEIAKSGRQLQVVFAGSLSEGSEYGAAFAAELHKAEAAGYAAFVGFLDMPELIRLLDSSHAFLHFPSEEAFGLVVAEAMARGLKFFGANLGGIVDIACGIDGAELHDDFASLQAGITRWLDAGAPAPAQVADEIAKRYHPRVIAKRHIEIYREVLGR
jgi:glycosyltransferase involved in cell wall biosynthesis